MIATSNASVVLGHLELTGFQMYRGLSMHAGGMDPNAFDRFGLVMSGHFHHKSQNGVINYLGAPYPMIWSDYRDPRGFHILDTDTLELEFIENPYSIFKRIVYDDEGKTHDYVKELVQSIQQKDGDYQDAYVKVVVKSKTQMYWFDLMMDSLYKMNAQDIIVVDDIVVNEDESETAIETTHVDTLGLMNEFVDTLSINCDKARLKSYLQTKYTEALAASQSVRLS
jgi:DNA repair exonuclease SbcCD nuclease subunit